MSPHIISASFLEHAHRVREQLRDVVLRATSRLAPFSVRSRPLAHLVRSQQLFRTKLLERVGEDLRAHAQAEQFGEEARRALADEEAGVVGELCPARGELGDSWKVGLFVQERVSSEEKESWRFGQGGGRASLTCFSGETRGGRLLRRAGDASVGFSSAILATSAYGGRERKRGKVELGLGPPPPELNSAQLASCEGQLFSSFFYASC